MTQLFSASYHLSRTTASAGNKRPIRRSHSWRRNSTAPMPYRRMPRALFFHSHFLYQNKSAAAASLTQINKNRVAKRQVNDYFQRQRDALPGRCRWRAGLPGGRATGFTINTKSTNWIFKSKILRSRYESLFDAIVSAHQQLRPQVRVTPWSAACCFHSSSAVSCI